MAWTHETVYQALIDRGERVKKSPNDQYVTLYRQETNCALLYAPNSSAQATPLHINKSRSEWRPELLEQFGSAVEWVRADNKGPGKDAQNFDHYRVVDWDQFAKALRLGGASPGDL